MLLHLHQDRLEPGLTSRQDAPHVVLECNGRIRHAERHADVTVRGALTPANMGRPEELLRCVFVEPWDVDADAQLAALVRSGSCAGGCKAMLPSHGSCLQKLLGCLGDELLSAWCLAPSSRERALKHASTWCPSASLVTATS